ncbi:MAG: radical SAM protein [Theionarchaea archaeon]|nr:radical SAM protein [Theionarchaea archaeon]MBU7000951.1 radical SAM protein [Theionarchaea archaeon]MBU7021108.1 radical SAM protein [Theionarchaea archaeon]MBU7033834.1 radical SAM protein [Theionarchaea archaeon]MBU7039898.1 radical SAM protein [Theionarchaea archaeon]
MLTRSRYAVVIPVSDEDYLFVNTFTGHILQGKNHLKEILDSENPEACDAEAVKILQESGFLTTMSPREEIIHAYDCLTSFNPVQDNLFFVLILTYACNMRCDYCFESYVFEREKNWLENTMSFDHVDKAFEIMETMNPEADTPIHLFGGEPLLYRNYDLVKYVLEKGSSQEKSFIIVTNGLEAKRFIPLLSQHDITSVQVTLDGLPPVHDSRKKKLDGTGSFQEIVASVDALADEKIRVYVRVVFDHSTVRDLPSFMDFAEEKGWKNSAYVSVFLTPQRHHTEGGCFNFVCNLHEEDLDFLVEEESVRDAFWVGLEPIRKKLGLGVDTWIPCTTYCRQNPSQVWLDPHGDIYMCTDTLGDREHAVGRYYPELVLNRHYHQWKERTIFTMNPCHSCKYAMICGGGCAHYVYHEKGTLLRPDCTFSKQARTIYYPLLWRIMEAKKVIP